ncbi:RING-type E3 ubiquitin transferase [Trifolium repens]|nr:RING-type E3 ubiquitin transferase [Trifolium repens]
MASDPNLETKYELNAKVMVGSSVLLFILIIIVVLFRTYVYLCHHRRHRQFSQQSLTTTTFKEEPLNPSVLKSIPTFMFSSSASHRTLHDCAVCLSEFTDGDVCQLRFNRQRVLFRVQKNRVKVVRIFLNRLGVRESRLV